MTLDEFADEMRPYHNQICLLYDSELVRLVGVSSDDRDRYYVVQSKRPYSDDLVMHASAVGHLQPLKGLLPDDAYARMENQFTLNKMGPTDTFLVQNDEIWAETSTMDAMISKCGRVGIFFDENNPDDRFTLMRIDNELGSQTLIAHGELAKLERIAKDIIDSEVAWHEDR